MAVDPDQLVHGLRPALHVDQEEHQQMPYVREHRVVGAGRVHREHRALDRLRHHLAAVEALHEVDLRQVLVHREQRQRGEQGALRGAGGGGRRERLRVLARAVPPLAVEVQRRDVRAHVRRGPVDDLRPELVELLRGVAEAPGHRQLHDVRDGVARRQQGRPAADRTGLLKDDPEVVAPRRRGPPRLLHQELRVHRRPARVLRGLRAPGPQPRAADAGPLRQLQRGRAGERLHPLPAQLALLRRTGQQLGRGLPLLGALDHVEHVEQVLVGAGHPDVQLLLTGEAVRVRVGGVRRTGGDLADTAPAPHDPRTDDGGEQAHREQEPQNLHGPIVPGPASGR